MEDILRYKIAEYIEEDLAERVSKADDFLEGGNVTLEADGWVSFKKNGQTYHIKVSHAKRS